MKKIISSLMPAVMLLTSLSATGSGHYTPTPENIASRQEFRDAGLGIFIHWGIYSMFGQNEWYLNRGINAEEYAKAASGFYPARFDASEWVRIFKDAGAKYICITSRHHDGFSMFDTKESDYDIVDATPFKRDVIKEIADECHKQGMRLHLYYSHLDWTRPDYPQGRTGRLTGRDSTYSDWANYYTFMNNQLTELLTNYGPIGAIWFDGWWDHDSDETPFDWQLKEQYELIHRLQPACLVGNNHHQVPFEGEDIQIFERDLPGENTAGLSGQAVSRLPLETCLTMNRSWGYNVKDLDYQSTADIIRSLVRAAGKGANLLLNVGPQPNGEIPSQAVTRLAELGKWMKAYGHTVAKTEKGEIDEQAWGVTTRNGNTLYVHILNADSDEIFLPIEGAKIKKAILAGTDRKVEFKKADNGYTLYLKGLPTPDPDTIIELTTTEKKK